MWKTLEVQLSKRNPILAPKAWSTAFRVKVTLPYLGQSDEIFPLISQNSFHLDVNGTAYPCSLNHEVESCFRIIPGDNPIIELCLDVYTKSFDSIYYTNNLSIILPSYEN